MSKSRVDRIALAIRVAIRDHDIDDHHLHCMGDPRDWRGDEAARTIAEAVMKEIDDDATP